MPSPVVQRSPGKHNRKIKWFDKVIWLTWLSGKQGYLVNKVI